jgi:1-acyl-sn-glycerol-3-phosphate acyltransferase
MGRQINTMYYLIHFLVRLGLRIYCYRVRVNDGIALDQKGPMVLASNHPNGFFDAIVLASHLKRPMHFMATGELTDKWLPQWALKILHIIPVYQLTDIPASQEENEKSFSKCIDILSAGGIVLFFSEGICENNWQLRPFKKGTARVVLSALAHTGQRPDLFILPVALNYNSYTSMGKSVFIQCGQVFSNQDLPQNIPEPEKINLFNTLLRERISASMLQSEDHPAKLQLLLSNIPVLDSIQTRKLQHKMDTETRSIFFEKLIKPGYLISGEHGIGLTIIQLLALSLPAAIGWVLHFIFFYPLKYMVRIKTAGTVFFDSVMFTVLFILYPVYWILINVAIFVVHGNPWIQFIFLFMPLFAWTSLQWHVCAQRLRNYFFLAKKERSILKHFLA